MASIFINPKLNRIKLTRRVHGSCKTDPTLFNEKTHAYRRIQSIARLLITQTHHCHHSAMNPKIAANFSPNGLYALDDP